MSIVEPDASRITVAAAFGQTTGKCGWGRALLLVCLAAAAVVTPMLFLEVASGHDVQFHLASWMDVLGQWREGTLFPRWAEWANWGYGEPRFIFYPPASWILGAGLGAILPWQAVPGAFAWIGLTAAGMSAWRLARDWMPRGEAAAAAVFYAVNPYNVAIVYYRSDFAELLAVALFPLLICGALRAGRNGWSALTLVAVPLAGIWLSNAPAAVILTYSLCLALVAMTVTTGSWRAVQVGVVGLVAGFGLAAVYILPAAWEQKWVQIQEAVAGSMQPAANFLFAGGGDPDFRLFNARMSWIAIGMIATTAVSVAICLRSRKESCALRWTLAALALVSACLMISPSAPLWRLLPKLQFVQFPWRWLIALSPAFALFAAMASPGGKRGRRVWLALVGLLIAAEGVAIGIDSYWDTDDVTAIVDSVRAGKGYEGTDEYAPLDCDRDALPQAGPKVGLVNGTGELRAASDAEMRIARWSGERIELEVSATSNETLVLRRLNYPSWNATIDSQRAPIESAPDTGAIELTVPEGTHRVEVRFARTWDRDAGGAISLLSAIGLAGFEAARRRRRGA
ncbi:MAG TPA: 6-pyruvoyl-tetrahydropterin synthase-related protein [Candidatus Acidoferrum sp.]|nr:6-pyruvoyl-tetrahydropterin synthase-related protein [Candidatus Acidoferrum sp.]